jgi:hypothetical protein
MQAHPQHYACDARRSCYRSSFGVLVTKICLQVVTDISTKPIMKIQDPLRSQTLMKSNAQLRNEG